ncbi:MAG: chemotaxis protein CheB [Chlorobiaceae bacterium]|nr:chemotaxis protein CheB [Chlorobiaceae bacterium]NTW73806.1 chemotaxis protein CheB [Chlorobiaceae bacterium]
MKKKLSAPVPKVTSTESAVPGKVNPKVPVVGIGASAGGLEAIEMFLKHVPVASGMAFVIVQHLDPARKGFMVELLQRVTPMPVVQVVDNTRIEADHVYVIPPNKDMSLLKGLLNLIDPVKPHGLRLPIDFFFRSLAEDLQQYSIGVILSGMGSDGTLGLRAIKEKGGGVFVQDPSSAKYDSMPRSAIDAGLADVVSTPEALPERIVAYVKFQPSPAKPAEPLEQKHLSGLEKVLLILRAHTRQDFSLYKKSTVYRRIERRMGVHQIENIASYIRLLQDNPHETELLFRELLIGVTSFFRDPESWDTLRSMAIPALLNSRPGGKTVRAWVAGCSTGEEAYSLAIVFKEALELLNPPGTWRLQIFATDLDKDAIERARQALYPPNIAADVSPERLHRYFIQEEQGWRISRDIREMVVFAPQNVIMDPPFTRIDILVCRNLMIYWEQELQNKLLPLFHYSLNPGGLLFLGSAETVGPYSTMFEPIFGKLRIFRKVEHGGSFDAFEFPSSYGSAVTGVQEKEELPQGSRRQVSNMKALADQLILQNFAPSAVLTNDKGDIIYISGRTGKYLEPAAGKANWNIFAMAREGLRYELDLLFGMSSAHQEPVTRKGVTIGSDGERVMVNLTVQRVEQPEALKDLVLVVFSMAEKPVLETRSDIGSANGPVDETGVARIDSLERELKQSRQEIQSVREDMQASQEELNSANEELQSANEELQSTNEELTTSKEELQSLNEELQTVNHELQSKVNELSHANNDMKNLLNSTDIATLFLDESLNIRRFTTRTASIIKLIASDTGRPITDIVTELAYPSLADDAREVLQTLVFREKQVPATDGRWFNVKIMPYRTQENRIDGLVITFTDISLAKRLEMRLRVDEERYVSAFAIAGAIVDTVDRDLRYTWFCDPQQLMIPQTAMGRRDDELGLRPYATELMQMKRSALDSGNEVCKELSIRVSDGKLLSYHVTSKPLRSPSGEPSGVLTVALPLMS